MFNIQVLIPLLLKLCLLPSLSTLMNIKTRWGGCTTQCIFWLAKLISTREWATLKKIAQLVHSKIPEASLHHTQLPLHHYSCHSWIPVCVCVVGVGGCGGLVLSLCLTISKINLKLSCIQLFAVLVQKVYNPHIRIFSITKSQ